MFSLDTTFIETRRTYRAVFSEPEVVIPVQIQAETATTSTDPAAADSVVETTTAPTAQPAGSVTPSQAPLAGNGKKRLREELEGAEVGAAEASNSGKKSVVISGGNEGKRDSSQGPSAKKKKRKTKGSGQEAGQAK